MKTTLNGYEVSLEPFQCLYEGGRLVGEEWIGVTEGVGDALTKVSANKIQPFRIVKVERGNRMKKTEDTKPQGEVFGQTGANALDFLVFVRTRACTFTVSVRSPSEAITREILRATEQRLSQPATLPVPTGKGTATMASPTTIQMNPGNLAKALEAIRGAVKDQVSFTIAMIVTALNAAFGVQRDAVQWGAVIYCLTKHNKIVKESSGNFHFFGPGDTGAGGGTSGNSGETGKAKTLHRFLIGAAGQERIQQIIAIVSANANKQGWVSSPKLVPLLNMNFKVDCNSKTWGRTLLPMVRKGMLNRRRKLGYSLSADTLAKLQTGAGASPPNPVPPLPPPPPAPPVPPQPAAPPAAVIPVEQPKGSQTVPFDLLREFVEIAEENVGLRQELLNAAVRRRDVLRLAIEAARAKN